MKRLYYRQCVWCGEFFDESDMVCQRGEPNKWFCSDCVRLNQLRELQQAGLSSSAIDAFNAANELADMIVFHANVRENAEKMAETWEM